MARDRRSENDDFEIVSVEMYEPEDGDEGRKWRIDQSHLKDKDFKYEEIQDLKDEHQFLEMNQSFIDALTRIARKENDGSARHRFFIGMAYLDGIDVEVNHERALELIKSAAEDHTPCLEATSKLADMYLNGDGVETDLAQAILWQEKLASQYKAAYDEYNDPNKHRGYGTAYFMALLKLSDMHRDAANILAAIDIARQSLSFSEELEQEVGVREQERDKALILNRLGSLYRETGDYTPAEDCFVKASLIYEQQAAEIGTRRVRRDLSISYERLGDISRIKGDLSGADENYQKTREIRKHLADESLTAASRRDLSAVLTKLGNVRKSEKEYAQAGKYYSEALSMDRVLAQEIRSPQSWDDYGVSLVKAGDIHKAEDRLAEAIDCYKEACGIFRKNANKTGSLIFLEHLAGGCEKLASTLKKLGATQEAEEFYKESVTLREQLHKTSRTVSSAHALATAYYNTAAFLKDKEIMRRAYELWNELSVRHLEYGKYRDKAEKLSRQELS